MGRLPMDDGGRGAEDGGGCSSHSRNLMAPLVHTSRACLAALGVAALTLAGPVVAPADAAKRGKSPSVRVLSPLAGKTVVGHVRLAARARRSVGTVTFRVDAGKNRLAKRRSRTRRDAGVLDTTRLRSGRHTVTVRARVRGKLVVKRVRFRVRKPARMTLKAQSTGKGRIKQSKPAGVVPVTSEPTTSTAPATVTAPAPTGAGLFSENYETGDFSRWELFQAVATDRIRSVPAFGGRTGNVGRFEVRNGDHVNGEQNSRAELAWGGDMFSEGETHVFKWSTYFAPEFSAENGWAVTTQFKADGSGGPPLQLAVNGESFFLGAGEHVNYARLFTTPLVRGQWLDLTIRVHWSRDPAKGQVDMWYRGQKVVDAYKMPTLLPDRDNYFKLGLYRSADIRQTGVVYHDDLLIDQL